jgi:hypothetical protein
LRDHVRLDTLDGIEIAELLEYILGRLDQMPESELEILNFVEGSPYRYKHLRDDIERLIDRITTAAYSPPPPTPTAALDRQPDRGVNNQRPPMPGELCTCGRSATVVFQNERWGEVGWCGLNDAGRSGPCPFCHAASHDGQRCASYRLRPDTP